MALRLVTPPTVEPVTLVDAKAHLRITSSAEDALLAGLITAARQVAESECRRALITQTWEKVLDEFPDEIELPYPPIQAITSIVYIDTAGAQQTLASAGYFLDSKSEPGWVAPAYGYTWPQTQDAWNVVTITYRAGYGSQASDVPQAIRQWILLMVGHYYENREASVPGVVMTPLPFIAGLLDPYRVYSL